VTALSLLEEILRGDLVGWRGLPSGVTPEAIRAELGPAAGTRPPGEAIRASRRFLVTVMTRPEPPKSVSVWVEAGRTDVAIVELDEPFVEDLEGTLPRLGSPDLVLTDRRFALGAQVRVHVWSRRGLGLSIAEPFEPDPAPRRVLNLELFAATTPESYLTAVDRGAELLPKTHPEPAR
jgi:hypothetical protein